MVRAISILGCTGSIGRQTIAVAEHINMPVAALTANRKIDLLEEQARRLHPKFVAVYDEKAAKQFKIAVADTDIRVGSGMEGLIEAATLAESDCVVTAVSGSVGLRPTLAAIDEKKRIALANKETLVCAGGLVMDAADRYGAEIVPVDSEHSAIFQCVQGCADRGEIKRLILTCSGGPFYGMTYGEVGKMTKADALKHPNWKMGPKITVDCATLMNKGLEVIEAHHLFGVPLEKIQVVVHPQSVIHSMIEFEDGAILAQLGKPDMRGPISYAMGYPERLPYGGEPIDWTRLSSLTFEPPDLDKFPCLKLAYQAQAAGGTLPVALNAANEAANEAFRQGRICFGQISEIVDEVLNHTDRRNISCVQDVYEADRLAREAAGRVTLGRLPF